MVNIGNMADGVVDGLVKLAIGALTITAVFSVGGGLSFLDSNSTGFLDSIETEVESGMTTVVQVIILVVVLAAIAIIRRRNN